MVKGVMLVAVITGAAESLAIPGWIYMIVTLLGAGGLFRFFMLRTEKRLGDAGATKTEAEALEIQERVRTSLMADVEVAMQTARREAEHARTQEAAANAELALATAEVAKMVLEHQRDREAWREERHDLINTHRVAMNKKDIEIADLRALIADLQEKIRTMEIRLGYAEGRRDEDAATGERMTALEGRADESEARADSAEARADRAKQRADDARVVAVEQEHRNDDTPGHA